LMIAVVFVHDSLAKSSSTAGRQTTENRMIVNWGIVNADWRALLGSLRSINQRPRRLSKSF
jgi:hypothetical protein